MKRTFRENLGRNWVYIGPLNSRLKGLSLAGVLAFGLLFTGLGVTSALAQQQVENLGTFRFWTAWKGTDGDGQICYISSVPQEALPGNVNRDPIHFLVIHRAGLGTQNEIQTLVGYPLEANSTPEVNVDGRAFDMLVDGKAAWLASSSDEAAFVAAMKAGTEMVVKARSQRGTDTTDTYSLSGVTAALNELDESC